MSKILLNLFLYAFIIVTIFTLVPINNIQAATCGDYDFNGDSITDALDTLLVIQDEIDVNNDGEFNSLDELLMSNCAAGIEPSNADGALSSQSFDIKDFFQPAERFDTSEGIGTLASDIILILTSFAGVIAIIIIIISGIRFVMSSGDEKKLASAKGMLTYAIVGLSIVILAFIIIRVVQFFIGSDVPIR